TAGAPGRLSPHRGACRGGRRAAGPEPATASPPLLLRQGFFFRVDARGGEPLSAAREEKQKQVAELAEKLERAQAVILVDFRGLTVLQSSELRNRLRPHGVEFKVVKNTLARRAAQQVGLEGVDQVFEGPTAMAFAYHDPVAPARELTRFNRETGMPQIKGGILGGRFVDVDEIGRASCREREWTSVRA